MVIRLVPYRSRFQSDWSGSGMLPPAQTDLSREDSKQPQPETTTIIVRKRVKRIVRKLWVSK